MMMKNIWSWIITGVFLIGLVTEDSFAQASTSPAKALLLGFAPIPPQPISQNNWLGAFDLLQNNAQVVLHHMHFDWQRYSQDVFDSGSTEEKSISFISQMSARSNLKMFLVVDPLTPGREKLDEKAYSIVGRSFKEEGVRNAFKNLAVYLAREFKPPWLALGSEINTYLRKNPNEIPFFLSLYKETAQLVKQVSPSTKVTATFQYELLSGTFDGSSQWDLLKKFVPFLDVVAISTYPSPWFKNPGSIPKRYYKQLSEYTKKPIIIAESGWPSAGPANFHGSEENQAGFVKRFPKLFKNMPLRLWIWWFLHDWEGGGYPEGFKTMGLRKSDGTPKASWEAWVGTKSSP